MEAKWSRNVQHERLNLLEINNLIEDSGFHVVRSELLEGGKANTNYRLQLEDGQPLVLRIFQRDRNVAAVERAVIELVSGAVKVPEHIYSDPENRFCLTKWLDGLTIETLALEGRQEEADLAARDIGTALARISTHRFDAPGFLSPRLNVIAEWSSTVDGLFGYMFACLARPLVLERTSTGFLGQVESVAGKMEPMLRKATTTPCLVHGDFKASNILVDNGQLSGVLDWEFTHAGTFLLDIGQLFRHTDCIGPRFEEGFVQGFEDEGGVLPDDWLRLAAAIDMVSLVDFLGRESSGPEMVEDVISLITGTVQLCQ